MFSFLICSPNLAFYIRYTKLANDSRTDQEISKELTNYWQTLPNIVLKYTNIRFSSSTKYNSREKTKINEYGTLEIRDYRKIIKEFYVILMEKAISFLLNSRSKHLIWSFILGFLEGDGSVHTNKRRHFYIRLAANSNNVIILKQMLQIIGIQCSVDESMLKKNGKGVRIQIQILQILKNLNIIAPKIFLYYPKRRKMFVENFFKNRSVQYLIGSKIELGKQYVAKNFLDKEIIINPAIMAEIRLLEKELNNYGLTIAQLIDNLKN